MEEERTIAVPAKLLPIVVGVIALLVFLIARSRRQSEDERALRPIVEAINEANLPERAKEMLHVAVEEVRHTLGMLREMAPTGRSE